VAGISNSKNNIKRLHNFKNICIFILKTILTPVQTTISWFRYKRLPGPIKVGGRSTSLKGYFETLSYGLHRQINNFQMRRPSAGTVLPEGQKYLYFPLHIVPEYSTQFEGTMWMDQLHLIETFAKSIPSDWVVYVKEHPSTLIYRARPVNFYKEIQKFSNVYLAPIDLAMDELISKAQMVGIVTSTVGWEAILRGVPVISFGMCPWDCLGLSKRCANLETLAVDILKEYDRINNMPAQERKDRLIKYLAAASYDGFWITYANEFGGRDCEIDPSIDAHIGTEIGQAIIKYLERKGSAKELAHASLR